MNLKGYVEIYKKYRDNKKLYYSTNNLIVYNGREWVLQRIFETPNPNITLNLHTGAIYWISFGSGGSPVTSPLDPIPPSNTDLSLANEIVINDTQPDIYADNGRKHPIDHIEFIQDTKNANRYLIARIDCLLDTTEAVDQDINEAALWISDSDDALQATEFSLFARVTFPTIRKRGDFSLQFLWHIYA